MARVTTIWPAAIVLSLPFFLWWDRSVRATVSPRRRLVAWAVMLVAAPLGCGIWLGLLHRPRRRPP